MTTENVQQIEAEAAQTQGTPLVGDPDGQGQADAGIVDKDAEIARLSAANANLTQKYKSLQGTQQVHVSAPDVMARLDDLGAEVRTQRWEMERQRWEYADVDEDTKREKLTQINKEEQAYQATGELKRSSDRMAQEITDALTEAKIELDHPKVKEAIQKWGAARGINDYVSIAMDLNKFIVSESTKRSSEREDGLRRQYNVENGSLATGTGGGTPAGAGASWERVRDAYIEDPNDPKISKQYYEMRRARGL